MGLEKIIRTAAYVSAASAITFSSPAHAQEIPEQPIGLINNINPSSRAAVLGTTIAVNGMLCGIMAAVKDRNIIKDAGQCMAAGALQFMGMEIGMYAVPVLPGFALRIVETGTSIVENTVGGRKPFDILHYSLLGPGLLQIDTRQKSLDKSLGIFWRISPIIGINYNVAKGNKFDLLNTLSYQTITFKADAQPYSDGSSGLILGYAIGNVMTHDPRFKYTLAHEFSHTLQYVRFRPFQELIPKEISFLKDKAHLRIGEDITSLALNLPHMVCSLTGEELCARRWWIPTEVESYIMETGNQNHIKLPPTNKNYKLWRETYTF